MLRKIIAGSLLSMVIALTLGTTAFASPPVDQVPCIVECNTHGPNGTLCGAGVSAVARHLDSVAILDMGTPGASGHAQNTLAEVVNILFPPAQ